MLALLTARFRLPRTVVVLGLVSLLNDAASEMITPLLPVFLTATLGAGPLALGLVEGLAETTSSLLKLLSGWLADRGWRAQRLVLGGYAISNGARPLVALAGAWPTVLLLRFADRIGKGLRSAPRDALIACAVPASERGRAFGFHRGLDHAGAVLGPLLAFLLLGLGADVRWVFLASSVPGIAVLVLLVRGVPPTPLAAPGARPHLRWSRLDARLRALVVAGFVLALATVPEAFLVLWAVDHGIAILWVPLLWALAHVLKSAVVLAAGTWSDRIGRVPVVAAGWSLRVLMLAAIAVAPASTGLSATLFLAYAAALASTEGAERALIGDRAPAALAGTAFGLYHLAASLAALPGALLFGWMWQSISPTAAFGLAATLGLASALSLAWLARGPALKRNAGSADESPPTAGPSAT